MRVPKPDSEDWRKLARRFGGEDSERLGALSNFGRMPGSARRLGCILKAQG